MKQKLLFTVLLTVAALGMRAQTPVYSEFVVAQTYSGWTMNYYVSYDGTTIAKDLGYGDETGDYTAMKEDLSQEDNNVIEISIASDAQGGTTSTPNSYWDTHSYGCFIVDENGIIADNWWDGKAKIANLFDYTTDGSKIIIYLMMNGASTINPGIYPAEITLTRKSNNKSVKLRSTLVLQETNESNLTIVSEGTTYIRQTAHPANDWSSDYKWYWFNNSQLLAAGATAKFISDQVTTLLYTTDGTSLVNTHNTSGNGFWFKGTNTTTCTKATENQEFYVDHLICNEESWIGFYIGQGYGNLTLGQHRVAPLYLVVGNLAVKLNVVLDIADVVIKENVAYTPEAGDNQYVSLYRSISTGVNTLVLPFSLTQTEVEEAFGTGSKVYELGSYNSETGNISFVEADGITANRPCLLEATEASTAVPYIFADKTIENASTIYAPNSTVKMVGTYADVTSIANNANNYIFYNGSLYLVDSDNVKMRGTRAYIQLTLTGGGAAKNRLTVSFDGVATGIEDVRGKMEDVRGAYYDLQGRKISASSVSSVGSVTLPKGLYIINGKKVFIK